MSKLLEQLFKMPPIRDLEALLLKGPCGLIVDRRQRHFAEAAESLGFRIQERWRLASPLSNVLVHAALIVGNEPAGANLPQRIEGTDFVYTRVLDRFFLPFSPDPIVSTALFDLIADIYDRVTTEETNRVVALHLLRAVVLPISSRLRILDFGCGTGIALTAAAEINSPAQIELIGTDASPTMVGAAARRGMCTVSLQEWKKIPAKTFDGAIASFVLHYGLQDKELELIAKHLRPRARFAANYFKPSESEIERLISRLHMTGLNFHERSEIEAPKIAPHPLLIFIKAD
jgi:Methyltransferase domain